jgi:ATP-dependent Clp protease ATP-binding subunit ClpB
MVHDGEQRFSRRAHRALERAANEARRLRGVLVEPEHLLLAILRDDHAAGALLVATRGNLANGRLDLGRVIARLEHVDHPLVAEPASAPAPSARLRSAFDGAAAEAAALGDQRLSTAHLLLGVIAEAGAAADLLASFGVEGDQVRAALAQIHPYDEDEPGWLAQVHPV